MKTVSVFCGSSQKVPRAFFDDATMLARHLVENGYAIRYGGGSMGLMGALADETIRMGGKINGVIPHFMAEVEWEHKGVADMTYVDTMAERKQLLVREVAAVVALPGGTGTMEELFEVLSNKKLGLFAEPVILINTNGFYNPLIQMMQAMADNNFFRQEHLSMLTVVQSPAEVVSAINGASSWQTAEAMKIAAYR